MTDRRDPLQPERRRYPFGGRRQTDVQPSHGTRASYQRGCPCTHCKAAEAAYRADLRKKHLKGLPVLGALVSSAEARRRIRQLKGEGYTATRIVTMAGWTDARTRHVHILPGALIHLGTLLRIRDVADFAMLEGTNNPAE